jgi:type II secretory pathway pseudopilin PulG
MAAIAIPRYGSARATFRSRSAAIRLATDLTHAGALAQAQSTAISMIFAADGTNYQTVFGPDATGIVESRLSLAGPPYLASIDPASLPFGHKLTFDGFGQPGAQPTFVVNASQRKTSLSISASGRVTVHAP